MGISCHIFNAFKFSLLFSACGVGVMPSMQLNHGCTALLSGVNLVFLCLEMASTDEMITIAGRIKPQDCCLVPEKREELTTEGGLDVVSQISRDNHILILNMASVFTQVQSNTVCP
jgi:hypothetical protein